MDSLPVLLPPFPHSTNTMSSSTDKPSTFVSQDELVPLPAMLFAVNKIYREANAAISLRKDKERLDKENRSLTNEVQNLTASLEESQRGHRDLQDELGREKRWNEDLEERLKRSSLSLGAAQRSEADANAALATAQQSLGSLNQALQHHRARADIAEKDAACLSSTLDEALDEKTKIRVQNERLQDELDRLKGVEQELIHIRDKNDWMRKELTKRDCYIAATVVGSGPHAKSHHHPPPPQTSHVPTLPFLGGLPSPVTPTHNPTTSKVDRTSASPSCLPQSPITRKRPSESNLHPEHTPLKRQKTESPTPPPHMRPSMDQKKEASCSPRLDIKPIAIPRPPIPPPTKTRDPRVRPIRTNSNPNSYMKNSPPW